jgi:tetratricopeptide (TPR) repeat protein
MNNKASLNFYIVARQLTMRYTLPFFAILLLLTQVNVASAAFQDGKKKKKKKGEVVQLLSKADQDKISRFYLDAERLKVIEDYEAAIASYKSVLDLDPNNANAHYQLANIYLTKKNLDEAQKSAAEAVRLDDTNKWYLELLGDIYLNQGKAKEAEETYKKLLAKFPNNADYYLNLGFLQSRMNKYEEAIKTYNQFEKNFGVDEQVIMEKKNLYLRMNKFSEAVGEVHKLTDANPGDVEYMLMEAELYRANKMNDKALAIYKKILEIDPDNPAALLAETDLGSKNGTPEQSFENVKKIFGNNKVPADTKVKILFPFIQFWDLRKDQKQQAFELAEIFTDTHPDQAKAFAIKGDLYYLDEQDDKALVAYLTALDLNKDVFNVWQQIMIIYNKQREWQKLLALTNESVELFPNQAMIYLFKGGAESQTKDYEKAIKSYSRGEKMSAENTQLRAQFLANLGDTYHSLNKYAESDSSYEKALKLTPDNAYVLNNYSYYLSLRKQNLEKAKQMSAYSNKLEPDNNSFLDTYAWILFCMEDYKGAQEWQEKAIKAGGDKSGTIIEHYGDILFKLGKKDEAVSQWKRAKELGVDSTTIERKIAEQKFVE